MKKFNEHINFEDERAINLEISKALVKSMPNDSEIENVSIAFYDSFHTHEIWVSFNFGMRDRDIDSQIKIIIEVQKVIKSSFKIKKDYINIESKSDGGIFIPNLVLTFDVAEKDFKESNLYKSVTSLNKYKM